MSYRGNQRCNRYNSIPDRWLRCPRKSVQLIEGKFLIFKTPLSTQYNDQVPAECLFPVDFVFGSMKSHKLKMGLWIDLTNTSRFYNKEDVEKHDCKYLKLQCRGFGSTPSKEQTDMFNAVCHMFISSKPLEIIGVHCTHGFNRSGFMVVSFLVEKWDWELKAALIKFAEVRPPGIYKKDYLEELYRRYEDDEQFAPEPPPLPDWCFEETQEVSVPNNDDEDDNENQDDNGEDNDDEEDKSSGEEGLEGRSSGSTMKGKKRKRKEPMGNHKRKKEFVKKNPTFMAGVQGVEPVGEPILGEVQRRVQELCGWKRTGFPGSQPVSMTVENIELLSIKPYAVSWKADGVRYLMYIQDENRVFCIDRDNCVFRVNNLKFLDVKDLKRHLRDTLLDGEMVLDKFNGQVLPRYLVYDIVSLNGRSMVQEPFFPTRYEAIKKEITEPRYKAMHLNLIRKALEPFSVRAKDFCDIQFTAKFLSDKFCAALSHEPDGLIFQPAKEPYTAGTFDGLLKWKPPSLNSVDFKLRITTEAGVGLVPRKVGELYVGGMSSRFAVLGTVKNVQDLNNKIIECKFENNKWVFMRERTDKSFPNSYETAIRVTESIMNPVTQETLLSYIEMSRYTNPMPPPLAPPRSHGSNRLD